MADDSISVEDVLVAVSEKVGGQNIKSASRMNKAVVVFLAEVRIVDDLIESGITINDTFVPLMPLSSPAKKIVLSNVPPFIKNEVIQEVLERYGKLTAPIKMIPLGLKNPNIKHVMSFRRYTYMILNAQQDPLNLAVKLTNEGKDYTIFITSDHMRCFLCGEQNHVRQKCPNKQNDRPSQSQLSDQIVNQVNEHSEEVQTPPVDQTNINSNVENADMSDRQTGGEEELIQTKKDDTSSEQEQERKENNEDDDDNDDEVVEENLIQMSAMSSECVYSDNDSENDLESLESLSDEENTDRIGISSSKLYTVKQISDFLDSTKGARKPQIEAFFPDLKRFFASCKMAMEKATFEELSRQKRYRLKKIMTKVKSMTKISKFD